jgi:16S rRNA U516 pseudouridylate synthase RsuA-like enzyme
MMRQEEFRSIKPNNKGKKATFDLTFTQEYEDNDYQQKVLVNNMRLNYLNKPNDYAQRKKKDIVILFYKPFNVLCKFSKKNKEYSTLADFIQIKDVYAAGRLDKESEGLLILTNNG